MMKRTVWLLVALLLLAGCTGEQAEGLYSGTLIFNGEHLFTAQTALPGDLFMRAGTAELPTGASVAGSVFMLGGTLTIDGAVGGDLSLLGGRVTLGPTAEVVGDLRLGGGELVQAETAVVHGRTISGSGLALPELPPQNGWDDWLRRLSAALLLAGLGALLVRGRSLPVVRVGDAAVDHALVSGAVGVLAVLVLPALLVMMAFTIILIPLVIVVGLLLGLLVGYGLIAVGYQLGAWLNGRFHCSFSPPATAFGGTLLLLLAFEIPVLGDGLLLIVMVLVLGALLLTRAGRRPFTPPLPPETADLAGYARPTRPEN